jgi:plastocyanin
MVSSSEYRMRSVSTAVVVIIIVIVIAIGIVAFISISTRHTTTTQSPKTVQVVIEPGAFKPPLNWNNSHIVSDQYFNPSTITVVIGVNNTVVWKNQDSVAHTVFSETTPAGASPFSSGQIAPGSGYTYTFTVPGTYEYYCAIHPWMGGIVIVESG